MMSKGRCFRLAAWLALSGVPGTGMAETLPAEEVLLPVSMSGLYSEKTGKTYDAVVLLDDTGGKYVNFKLEFPAKKGRKK